MLVWGGEDTLIKLYYSFVGELGGYMGLLIGASVLTLLEFVDLFLYELWSRGFGSKSKKKDPDMLDEKTDSHSHNNVF